MADIPAGLNTAYFKTLEVGRVEAGGNVRHPVCDWYRLQGSQSGQRFIEIPVAERGGIPNDDLPIRHLDTASKRKRDQHGATHAVAESQRQFPVTRAASRLGPDREDDEIFRQRRHSANDSEETRARAPADGAHARPGPCCREVSR
jgi:hypothetical protein